MRILLIGNYGAGNLGDELLREALERELSGVHVVTVSASPRKGEIHRLPMGLRSLLTTAWWRIFTELGRADAVVFGGGTLFTDCESFKAPILWSLHAAAARAFKKPVCLSYQGLGPLRTHLGKVLSSRVIRKAAFLSLRDGRSKEFLSGMNIHIVQAFDPVFSLLAGERLGENACIKNVFTFIPRFSEIWSGNQIRTFRQDVQRLQKGGRFTSVEFLSFAPGEKREWHLCETLSQGIGRAVPVRTKAELLERLHRSAFVLSQRYHGTIASLALGIPCAVLGMSMGDKLMTLAEEIRFPAALLSAWDGSLELLLHDHPLSEDQRQELLKLCDTGKLALRKSLLALEKLKTRN